MVRQSRSRDSALVASLASAFLLGLSNSSRCFSWGLLPQFRAGRGRALVRRHAASKGVVSEVVDIVKKECPSFEESVMPSTTLEQLQAAADSLDTLEMMMELEDRFKVELEDDDVAKAKTIEDLANLIWRTPKGHKLRTVDDDTYIAMIRKSHAENRWGELENLEQNIPPQFIHKGPSLAEENGDLDASLSDSPAAAVGAAAEASPESPAASAGVSFDHAGALAAAKALRVPELKQRLRELGEDETGTKGQLVRKLADAQQRAVLQG
eukprot:TRINITY_DN101602_c0_g1_i1.p1 TRINITY_DN101602_c0_g1~~TRINITY_DN101602_c0_g1_i1.p1  ORF type:complete len:267 (-),score=60.73 TRINITY_DN101602_c0_g1_i1:8-808(-)